MISFTPELSLFVDSRPPRPRPSNGLERDLAEFRDFGQDTRVLQTEVAGCVGGVKTFVNEFWTSKQRAASSLQEVSYRACFKPQLPLFFIERLSKEGECVYDPFLGRGTTLVEAGLMGRTPLGCDINPLSAMLAGPRLNPPTMDEIAARLKEIPLNGPLKGPEELLTFYHPETLAKLCALRKHFLDAGTLDPVDAWIRMVALNRLTGHSPGFFSVYTLPPNQAVSVKSQLKINRDRNQTPPPRDVAALILKKSRQLLADCDDPVRRTLSEGARGSMILTGPASATPQIKSGSVSLVVTSPPFLDVVDYAGDNWLRCWFVGVDPAEVKLTVPKKLETWKAAMTEVLVELQRVLKSGGHIAFEVGEVRAGKVKLDEEIVPCGLAAGLKARLILINDQKFTKTANCWGVDNNFKGTNTNRVVVFQKS